MKKVLILIGLTCCLPALLHAQSVGLVLSGGGAKGLVHIGVIRALEEKGIPIDYIAGTSMGAIIGGLYAAGYSTEEMEKVFQSQDVELWMSGNIDNRYMYFFKKTQPNSSWLQIAFSLDSSIFKPTLPTNLISPKQLDLAFLEIMGSVDAVSHRNFDSLFVPFRCNATDIGRRKEVVFRNGTLKDAVRASMSFPFVFKPLLLDSCILYDGGMMNTFPLHIMESEFKPDYTIGVIASDLFTVTPSGEDIVSIVTSMITEPDQAKICLQGKGIILRPPVSPDLGLTDFKGGLSLIDSGYAYTQLFIDSIRQEVHREVPKEEVDQKRAAFLQRIPEYCIGSIKINGLKPSQEKVITPIMLHAEEVIPIGEFKKRYSRLLLEDKIESIYPHITYDSTKQHFHALLDVKQKKPFTFKFGGHISTGYYSTLYTQLMFHTLGLQSVSTGMEAYFGHFYNALTGMLRLDYYMQPPFYQLVKFGVQRHNYFDANYTLSRYASESITYYMVESNSFFQYDIIAPLREKSQWQTGFTLFRENNRYFHTANIKASDTSDRNLFNGIRFHAVLEYNTADYRYFSSKGSLIRIEAAYQTGRETNHPGNTSSQTEITRADRRWITINATAVSSLKIIRFYRLGGYTHIALSNLPMFSTYTATNLHANTFAPTPESNISYLPQFRNPNFAAVGLNNIFTLRHQIQLRLDAYYYQPFSRVEDVQDDKARQSKVLIEEFSMLFYAAAVYQTKPGPISVSLSLYPQSDRKTVSTFFNISFGYLLMENKIF
ncbi:MAG: patatin-like phospholipase family protein [Bacteroidales bacterium]|nr:patatin-like phospholipase family protein [Bacteroidales bacterium]